MRAILGNSDQVLVPGNFVRVRVGAADEQESLLAPDAALGSDQGGRYLLVLDQNNTVEQRKVTIGPKVGDLRVIETGLKPDDQVVIDGILRAYRISADRTKPSWWLAAPSTVLRKLAGRSLRGFLPREVAYWRGALDESAEGAAAAADRLPEGTVEWFEAVSVAIGALGQRGKNDGVEAWLERRRARQEAREASDDFQYLQAIGRAVSRLVLPPAV